MDYRGERLRLSADLGYQSDDISSVQRFITIGPAAMAIPPVGPFLPALTQVPPPPEAGSNYGVPWSYWKPTDKFAMVRGEFDVTDKVTAYAALGWNQSDIDLMYPSPTVINAKGDWVANPLKGSDTTETRAGLVGVRAELNTGPVEHLLNVSYSSIDREDKSSYAGGNAPGCLPFPYNLAFPTLSICSNLYNPVAVPAPTFGPASLNLAKTNLSSVGISDTLSILDDRIQVTVGARRQTAGTESTNLLTGTLTSSTEESVWSPAYAVLVKPLRNVALYANYIEGLQMGTTVPPTNGVIPYLNAGEVIAPYQTKQKEVGVKVDFGRISTTVAAFEIEQPSLVTTGAAPNIRQELEGEQRNRGIEVNVFGELVPTVRVLGGVAFIDGRLTKTANGINDGNKAQGVADTNVNIGAEWDTPFPGLTVSGRVVYTSDAYINAANTYSIPDWTRYDLGARYTFDSPWNGKPITVRFGVENVANSSYYAGSYTADGIVTVGAPRTYLLSTTVNF
jgi:iron complex outermembrane recepter protein